MAVATCMYTLQIYSEIQKQESQFDYMWHKKGNFATNLSLSKSGPAANLSLICNQIIAIQ